MPRPISIQLYSLRDLAKKDGMPAVLKLVSDIGFSGVEFAGYGKMKAADVKKIVDDLGLKISGAHTDAFDAAKADEVIADAKALGLTAVGSGLGPKDFETEDQIKAGAERINKSIEKLGAAGLKVYYHNHWWEWDRPNKGDLLFKLCPRLHAQFDIYWIQTAGVNAAKIIAQYADRTISIHVKDGPCEQGKPMTALGGGTMRIREALAAAEKSKAEWYIVELDACATDMVEAVRESYTFLTGNMLATGRK